MLKVFSRLLLDEHILRKDTRIVSLALLNFSMALKVKHACQAAAFLAAFLASDNLHSVQFFLKDTSLAAISFDVAENFFRLVES